MTFLWETVPIRITSWTLVGPGVTEPTDDPDDDIEAEVPDVREDEVPE